MNDMKIRKIRTVNVNERGQIVIPEDIRKGFGIAKTSTLVIIEGEEEIILKKESDVMKAIKREDEFWKAISRETMKRAWSKDDIWDKIYARRRR